ncbi:MAG: amino acid synthesis family protein [Burkholderiales bacterium]|nr:amino acid synthesis family protein [Burkholderiales bacterium]
MFYAATAALPEVNVRKCVLNIEDVWHDGGARAATPLRRGSVAAVLRNPYAGRYVAEIQPLMEALKPLGRAMAQRLIDALGGPGAIQAYGKGALIGLGGELEHGALWHLPGGYGMRELLEGSHAIVPSTTKVGTAGACIDIPIHHRVAAYVRSHFDTLEVRIADAPRDHEMMLVLAMTTGPRPHERAGGLRADQISKFDGQR